MSWRLWKKEFQDKWENLNKKIAYPYEYFDCMVHYKKAVDNLKKRTSSIIPKRKISYWQWKWTNKKIDKLFNFENGEILTKLYCKSDCILLADIFEKKIKVSFKEFDINPLHCVSLPVYTLQGGNKYTSNILETLQNKELSLLLKNIIRVGYSSVMGDRYVKSDDNKKILCVDANNVYGWAMSQFLLCDEVGFDKIINLQDLPTMIKILVISPKFFCLILIT